MDLEFNLETAFCRYESEYALMNEALYMLVNSGWKHGDAFSFIFDAHITDKTTAKDICEQMEYRKLIAGYHSLSVRTTHKYVGTYSHLDNWDTVGLYKQIGGKALNEDESAAFDATVEYEYYVHVMPLKGEALPTVDVLKAALEAQYTKDGCHHDHDCCGCVSTRVGSIEDIGGGTVYKLVVSATPNY